MAIIGSFSKKDAGFQGTVTTLTLKTKLTFTSVEKTSEQAPDYRIFAGTVEVGAGWSTTSKAGNAYVSVKLDDPSFSAPIQCRLLEGEQGHVLVWNR